jgi:hypothetical protein
MPPEAARAGTDRVWTMGWPFWARPDSAGSGCSPPISTGPLAPGAELRGPIGMLLLLLTGRTGTALPQLSGPGVRTLTERLVIRRAEADQS